jgi:hypothetical protein
MRSASAAVSMLEGRLGAGVAATPGSVVVANRASTVLAYPAAYAASISGPLAPNPVRRSRWAIRERSALLVTYSVVRAGA